MVAWLALAAAEPPPLPDPAPTEVVPPSPIDADRVFEVLPSDTDPRLQMKRAGEALGDWTIDLAGLEIDGPWLVGLADTEPGEPFLRVVREKTKRAFDVDDLLLFLDDVLVAGKAGRRGEPFFVPAGRARGAGILVHPDDVWNGKPRRYPNGETLAVDEPVPRESLPPAADGAALGPEWVGRYPNPSTPDEMYATLSSARPDAAYASRIAALVSQLEQQGAEVWLTSFLRRRERGYLMWGASVLSKCTAAACVDQTVAKLVDRNRAWGLDVPITWAHPDGWEATREAARRMAESYDVVYATENGARSSNHYDGTAADFVASGLPRRLELLAPDGARRTFDLSDPQETRDLSLSPELCRWVEAHFAMRKLVSDYPHWDDVAP